MAVAYWLYEPGIDDIGVGYFYTLYYTCEAEAHNVFFINLLYNYIFLLTEHPATQREIILSIYIVRLCVLKPNIIICNIRRRHYVQLHRKSTIYA